MKSPHWICAAIIITGSAATQLAAESDDRWSELYRTGLALYEQEQYQPARAVLLDALAEAGKTPPNDDRLPATLHTLGVTEKSLKQYADARRHLEAALDIWSTSTEPVRQKAATLETLAYLLAETGDWHGAEQRLFAALAIHERLYGAASCEAALFLSRMSAVYIGRGQLENAKALLYRALDIEMKSLAAGDLELLTTKLKLAHTLRGLGDVGAARQYASEAETAGRSSPIYPEILAVLGDVYRLEGDTARAVPLLRRAIALAAARPSERELPAAVLSLAYIDLFEGRLISARDGLRSGLAMMERGGVESPAIATAQVGLALLLALEGKYPEASALLDAAHPILKPELSGDHFFQAGEHFFQALELIVRATIVAARGDRVRTLGAARLATGAVEQETPRNQVTLWQIYARLMKPHRRDVARNAEARGKTLARGFRE